MSLRIPGSIIANPGTAASEAALDRAVWIADRWTRPGQDERVGEVDPELLRPTASNLALIDRQISDIGERDSRLTNEHIMETGHLSSQVPRGPRPDCEFITMSFNDKTVAYARALIDGCRPMNTAGNERL